MADEQTAEPIVEEKPSRAEALAAALDAAEASPPDAAPADDAAPTLDRPRDEQGKFLPKAASEPVLQGDVNVPPAVTEDEPVWKRPPNSWKKDFHEVWATAASDPKLQPLVEYAYRREEEMRAGIEPLIPKAKFADQVMQAMEPFQENIRASGVEPVQALQSLMVADHNLRTMPAEQKAQYGLGLLQAYGVPLEAIYTALANPQPQIPPGYVPVQNVENIVRHQLSAWEQSQLDGQLQTEIEQFAAGKPDFEEYRPAMQALLEKGLVPDLASAYEKAKRLDDTAFGKMTSELQAQAIAEKREAADQAAKKAKAAAVSVPSSSPRAAPPTNAKDRRSALEEQFSALTERF